MRPYILQYKDAIERGWVDIDGKKTKLVVGWKIKKVIDVLASYFDDDRFIFDPKECYKRFKFEETLALQGQAPYYNKPLSLMLWQKAFFEAVYSFFEKEKELEEKIEHNPGIDFGIVVFDVNGLKFVNDTYGHEAGDRWIRNACKLICDIYQHSPVYRIGGDEFVVCLENTDYENREELLRKFNIQIEHNKSVGKVVIAAGQATYHSVDDFSVRKVFDRADHRMYIRKKELKESK